ncbi:MAG: radical SAM protein [Candidatus Omnitrophica bacterium]|nr:radical SAM protein [Candidatus Omnitrophota bacterium]
MKIVLVNLPWKKRNQWGVRAGSRWPHLKDQTEENYLPFPFYLAYAVALLKKNGFDAQIIDAIAEKTSYESFYKKIVSLNPDLLVVETSTVTLNHDMKFLSRFKGNFPIALCGPDVHIAKPEFLKKNNNINYVLFGEYEASLLELAQKLKSNDTLGALKGILYRQGDKIIKNSPRELISDLDWLPWPQRKLLPVKKYNDAPGDIPLPCASMWASRGCPYKCSFCLWPQVMYGGNSYRVRNVKNVVDEIEYLVNELGFKSVYFDDDTWNVGRKRIIDFCRELKIRNLQIPWAIMARAELMDEELLEIMRDVGLFAVKYGIESSSQRILDNINKGLNLKKAEEMIKYTKYLGIRTHLTFTFGLPGETQQTIKNTIDYALLLNPTSVQFSLATPFPGTKFYETMDKKGYILTKDLEKFDGNHSSVIRTEKLTAKQLQNAKKLAYVRWQQHYRMKRKKLAFEQKPLKAKLKSSLIEKGAFETGLKVLRFLIRKIFPPPERMRNFLNKNLWIIEEFISSGNIKIRFGEGQVRLYWKDREISKGVGLTTSFYYGERWFDSSQANWKLEKESPEVIIVKLNWDDVPVRQCWKISIDTDHSISWTAQMEVKRAVQLLEYKSGIMLQPDFNMWKDDLGVGKFPQLQDWEEIELYNSKSKKLTAFQDRDEQENRLPVLELSLAGPMENNTYPQIQNTDLKTKARILQMRCLKIEQFAPGQYDYLDLKLRLEDSLVQQSISAYKRRVPMKFFKTQLANQGLFQILKKMRPKKIAEHYLDILGVLDGSYAYKGPFCVQIDLTNDCNNDCIGCWCNSPLLNEKKISDNIKQQTLPLEVVKKTIDQLYAMGTKEIYFAGGGEPFMHPDIMKILEHVKSKGLRCYINTNFTLVNEDIVKKLVELKVDNLVISVWAGEPQTYLKTHPNKSEEMFFQIKGMLKLLNSIKKNLPHTNIYNVISSMNYDELGQMMDFAIATDSNSLEFTVIDTIPNATDSLILTDDQRQHVLKSAKDIEERLKTKDKNKVKVFGFEQFIRRVSNVDAKCAKYDKDILAQLPCYIGWLFARILADGNVNFCLKAHRIPVGNIYADSFLHIWNNTKQQEFRKRALHAPKDDVFFSFIGNDPDVKVGCYKSCDDLARNVCMHKKIQSLSALEIYFLRLFLLGAKIKKCFKEKKVKQTFQSHVYKRKKQAQGGISQNKLHVQMHDEGIKLFWDKLELTQGVGLNSSVCIFGLWHDSSKAKWEVTKRGNNELVIKNNWQNIPIAQEWQIKIDSSNSLLWQINTRVDSRIEIEQSKASMMLSSVYTRWNTTEERGKFPLTMSWNEANIKNSQVKRVSVLAAKNNTQRMPGISFDFSLTQGQIKPQVQNSDKIINARVVSVIRTEENSGKVFLPGNYEYFSVKIDIGDNDG